MKIILALILTISLTYTQESNTTVELNTTKLDINSTLEQNITKELTKVDKLISLAKSKFGSPYVYANAGPDKFDCSGFVYFVFKSNDIKIPRTSRDQSKSGDKLTRKEIKKGDILLFDTSGRGHVNHSGVYLGDGKFIHASSGKAKGVTISSLDKGFYPNKFRWGIRKIEEPKRKEKIEDNTTVKN
ncbi:MAG: C40 family peptidase [Sulfurovum sp.]